MFCFPEKFLTFLQFAWDYKRTEDFALKYGGPTASERSFKLEGYLIGFMDASGVNWRAQCANHQTLAMRKIKAAFPTPSPTDLDLD